MSSEGEFQGLIDAAFRGDLAPARWSELRLHVADCAACRQRYNRAAAAERVLGGSPTERMEGAIFAALAPARPSLASRLGRARDWLQAPRRLAVVGLAGAALALAVVLPLRGGGGRAGGEDPGTLRARGGGDDGARPAALRAFCIDGERATPLDREPTCPLGGVLKLTVDNPGGWRYVFVVGVQADGAPRWYEPRPPATLSMVAPAAAAGAVPFGSALRLAVNHEAGPLRIHALFSDEPLAAAEVEAALARAPAVAATLQLPPAVAQRSALVELTP